MIRGAQFRDHLAIRVSASPEAIFQAFHEVALPDMKLACYDWLDNGRKPSATRIVPDLQHPTIGTVLSCAARRDGQLHRAGDRP